MEFTAEILCLGNELLIGRTINRNATDISLELTKIGFIVLRETSVRDDLSQASEVLSEIVDRKPNVIIITGGLGPTHDDIQLEVIGKSISKDLVLNDEAVNMMVKRYNLQTNELTPQMVKMASLPAGGKPLINSEGSAPGVELSHNGIHIYSLPGIPKEMNAILIEEVIPSILRYYKPNVKLIEYGFNLRGTGESRIVEITNQVRAKFPSIGFKSHPKRDDTGYWMALHTYKIGDDETLVKEACQYWFDSIKSNFDVELSAILPIFDEEFEPE
ncbi:MAG: molybdopterin-binding protein [Candidatus Kariarchaeaceae archaeon]|jgi:molybdopterin-biosynthesis enzyme MoeA-like protein